MYSDQGTARCWLAVVLYFGLLGAVFVQEIAAGTDDNGQLSNVEKDVKMEALAEKKLSALHVVDNVNLIVYCFLLILSTLTTWFFQHKRFSFIHQTGLTLIYGMVAGILVSLLTANELPSEVKVLPDTNITFNWKRAPPDVLLLEFPSYHNKTPVFAYRFDGEAEVDETRFEEKATFDPEIFMNILLPPIIFNAGYSLKRRHFFRNIGSILLFALLGTTVSCVVVGLILYGIVCAAGLAIELVHCLFFGALISATDPVTVLAIFQDLHVDVDLFAMVFGESALNDAVALVLAKTVEHYSVVSSVESAFDFAAFLSAISVFFAIFMGSLALGAVTGCLTALLTKFVKIGDFSTLETALFVLTSYMSFLIAEACGMSGIVSVLICGICQAHYTFNNLSEESKVRTKQLFELISFVSESFIFAYIGVSMFTSQAHHFEPSFILGSVFAIAIGRAIFVYPFSWLLNVKRKPPIPWNHQNMMFFAGLRGAIAFSLAIQNTVSLPRRTIYTTTSLIVIFTVIFNGGLTTNMISWLGIRTGEFASEGAEGSPQFQPVSTDPEQQANDERRPVRHGQNPWDKAFLPRKWYNFDAKYMKPLLTHSRPTLMETAPSCCRPFARLFTSTKQLAERQYTGNVNSSDMNLVAEGARRSFDSELNGDGSKGLGVVIRDSSSMGYSGVDLSPYSMPVESNIPQSDSFTNSSRGDLGRSNQYESFPTVFSDVNHASLTPARTDGGS